MSPRVLLTVSGEIPKDLDEQIAEGVRPRADYLELAGQFGADIVDVASARATAGRIDRLIGRIAGPGVLLALACFRRRDRYDAIFTDGEQVGLPLAALFRLVRRRPRHLMIVHILSVPKKSRLIKALRLGSRIDRMVVYASAQRHFIVDDLHYDADAVVLTPFMVDTAFFSPDDRPAGDPPLICSAGLEFRDYPTLIEAVRGLEVRVVLAAASPWSKRSDSSSGIERPDNVEVRRLGFADLRELYAQASIVVVPVVETDFQAGITTILEAMAMGKPVICTRTSGQTDTIVDGRTGLYVAPGDVDGLRRTIVGLLDEPERRASLGAAAREWVVEHADIEVYAERLGTVVEETLDVR